MPLNAGPMSCWACRSCGGRYWLMPGIRPGSLTCNMMGCSGKVGRASRCDWPDNNPRTGPILSTRQQSAIALYGNPWKTGREA